MKKMIPALVLLAALPAMALAQPKIDQNCRYKGIALQGKVKKVSSGADIKIKRVSAFPDLKVQMVKSFPDKCGKWQWVDSFPDFTVQFVDAFPELSVSFVTAFPGLP